MNKLFSLVVVITLLLASLQNVYASGFNLKTIGSVETNGQATGHWWYTANNPLLAGDAMPTVAVDVSIDGVTETAPTSSDGTWQYKPKTLTDGDHEVVLTSGGNTIKFTLTIGVDKVDWTAVEKGGGEALPATGVTEMTWGLLIAGLAAIGLGGKMVFNAAKE